MTWQAIWQGWRLSPGARIAVALCTRLPVASSTIGEGAVARASWALPLAGALIGLIAAAVYWLAERLRYSAAGRKRRRAREHRLHHRRDA